MISLEESYTLLQVAKNASDAEITKAFKRLALLYHPDKNPKNVQWANRAMAALNSAYSVIIAHRFKDKPIHNETGTAPKKEQRVKREIFRDDVLTQYFVQHREKAKDALYQYFQYSLYNLLHREKTANAEIFQKIVRELRRSYHGIEGLCMYTSDEEFLQHFNFFKDMLFTFYKSSECLTIIDSYANIIDVEAFRMYRKGSDHLLLSQREIFYERHNRGFFKKEIALTNLLHAIKLLHVTITRFPQSSWIVESQIKLEHAQSLEKYLTLFF